MGRLHAPSGFLFLWMVFLALYGCGKDLSPMLTEGIWTFQDLATTSGNDSVRSSVDLERAFLTDATLAFGSDGTFQIRLPLLTQPTRGTWMLSGNDRLTLVVDNMPPSNTVILLLTEEHLSYREFLSGAGVADYTITTSWAR